MLLRGSFPWPQVKMCHEEIFKVYFGNCNESTKVWLENHVTFPEEGVIRAKLSSTRRLETN